MGKLSQSIFNLIKSFLARPAKPSKSKLHWVKADKPLNEMTTEERKKFSSSLADSIMKQIKNEGK